MLTFNEYISQNFSNELQLICILSQENITSGDTDFVKKLIKEKLNWKHFIYLIRKHRLSAHIYKNVAIWDGVIPPEVKQEIKQIRIKKAQTALLYARQIIDLNAVLQSNKISCLFFKGPLLSQNLYEDIAFREFGDIDMLVAQEDLEKAHSLILNAGYKRIEPGFKLSKKQQKVNYSISHHYHYRHKEYSLDLELHWNLTNPKTFVPLDVHELMNNAEDVMIAGQKIPYISEIENLVFLAAHGSVHQWYRLFWLKDFSKLKQKVSPDILKEAWDLSIELKLKASFLQAVILSHAIYRTGIPDYIANDGSNCYCRIALKSISTTELKQQGFSGRIKYVFYRIRLRKGLKYKFSLLYRLRTHYTDWEILNLPDSLFFLYYFLRPILLFVRLFVKKS